MAALGVLISYLGTLQYDSGGGSFVDMGQLVKFSPPKQKFGKSKNSYLGQAKPIHTYQAGWGEPGEVTFTINLVSATYNTLLGLINPASFPQANRNFRVRYNDGNSSTSGSTLQFNGFLAELGDQEVSRDSDNLIMTDGMIVASGAYTFTVAT